MLAKTLGLAFVLAAITASPLSRDPNVVNYDVALNGYLQAWSKVTVCGYPADKLPKMAPLTLRSAPLNYQRGETSLKGELSNMSIMGLNKFQIDKSIYDEAEHRYSFDIVLPEIHLFGSYELEGIVSISGIPTPVRHSVVVNKKVLDFRFVGNYTFAESKTNANGLRISDFHLNYYVAAVKSEMWDKYLDTVSNNIWNDFIVSSSMVLAKKVQPLIKPMMQLYMPEINQKLANLTLTQLIGYYLMQTDIWNKAACKCTQFQNVSM